MMPFYELSAHFELTIPKSDTEIRKNSHFGITAATWRDQELCFHDERMKPREKDSIGSRFWWRYLDSEWEEDDEHEGAWRVYLRGPLWIVPLKEPVRLVRPGAYTSLAILHLETDRTVEQFVTPGGSLSAASIPHGLPIDLLEEALEDPVTVAVVRRLQELGDPNALSVDLSNCEV